jgi:hypothetical protein
VFVCCAALCRERKCNGLSAVKGVLLRLELIGKFKSDWNRTQGVILRDVGDNDCALTKDLCLPYVENCIRPVVLATSYF